MTSPGDTGRQDNIFASRSGRRKWSWFLLALAVPGAAWSLYGNMIATAPFFGELPTATDHAASRAISLSGASLWLVTGVVAAVLARRMAVPLICAVLALGFSALGLADRSGSAPLDAARPDLWLSAWVVPTSWPVAVVAVMLLVRGVISLVSPSRATAAARRSTGSGSAQKSPPS